MSGAGSIAVIILCFAGGYILVTSLFEAFSKKRAKPVGSMADHFRAVLALAPGASGDDLQSAYFAQRDKYLQLAENGPDEEMRALARRRLAEVEDAYAYFIRNPANR